jgi:hypothetical protein
MKNLLRKALLAVSFACIVAPGLPSTWLGAGGEAAAQQSSCDRQCLTGVLTTYLNAMVAHNPKAVPVAANFRFTEDMKELKLGEGVWQSPIALGTYRMDFIDVRQGVAAVHAVLEENGMPILFGARLKVVDRKLTEAETLVVRTQAESMLFAPANLKTPSAEMLHVPTAAERMPRDAMVAVAAKYPEGLRIGSFVTADVAMAPNAYRFENGVRMAGPGCTFQPPSCENMKTQRIPTLAGMRTRLVAVDEEMGQVVFMLRFGRGSLVGPQFDGKELVTFEAFKVYGGAIHAAEAVFKGLPIDAASGWD